MVVKIDANHGDNGEAGKSLFIGREKEINEIIEDVKSNKGTRLLLVGESGIGKSALLDEVYRRVIQGEDEDQKNRPFVGYYSKKESLIAESESLIYPFSIVLEKLVNNAKESQQVGEKIDSTMARVKKGLLKFGKEQGIKMGVAIIEDVANKVGLKETLDVGKDILKDIGSEKTSLMLAQQYIADHRDEARQSYLEIFKAIADEFKERRFVLIFDQFESVGKASTDFFLNFVKFLTPQDRFDIIVSFRTDDTTWNDSTARKVYEDLERKMTYDLGAKKIPIEGLSAEDIGKWIKHVRGILLPLRPDLQRICENSAGLPLLLDEWIKSSKDLKDYDNIKRDKLCIQIIGLEDGLTDEQDQVRLDRMCILLYPLKYERLATYLGMDDNNVDLITAFLKRLHKNRIFDQNLRWFRHDLVKKCFEDRLGNEQRTSYHERAAKFFESLMEEKPNRQANNNTNIDEESAEEIRSIVMSYPYHLHMAGGKYHEKSFTHNKELAGYAFKKGDLDVAERCYKRAIDDAKYLGRLKDGMDCLWQMTASVYYVWGRYEEAVSNYHSLLKYYDSINDSRMRAFVLINIAMIHNNKGEYEQATELYSQSLEIAKQVGDKQVVAGTLINIAMIHAIKGEYEQALRLYNESFEITKQIGDQYTIGTTLNNIAMIHYNKREYEQALRLYNESLKIKRQRGDEEGIAGTLNNIAMIHNNKGEYEQATELFNESLKIMRRRGDQLGIAGALNNVALAFLKKENYEEALSHLLQAYKILERLDISPDLQRTHNILGYIKSKLGSEAYQRLVEKVEKSQLS